jgi:hypothetical protein
MLIPTNAPAQAIIKMQQENFGYQSQIDSVTKFINENNQIIEDLQKLATWDEVEDVEEPDTNPADGLAPPVDPPPTWLPVGMIVPEGDS